MKKIIIEQDLKNYFKIFIFADIIWIMFAIMNTIFDGYIVGIMKISFIFSFMLLIIYFAYSLANDMPIKKSIIKDEISLVFLTLIFADVVWLMQGVVEKYLPDQVILLIILDISIIISNIIALWSIYFLISKIIKLPQN